ncbi:hypothetical protein HK100_004934, partial [Physocladia obscura]
PSTIPQAQYTTQQQQQQQQHQLAGMEFFSSSNIQSQLQFASFASFPITSTALSSLPKATIGQHFGSSLLQSAFGSALLPGAAKPAIGRIPDFMDLRSSNNANVFGKGISASNKDLWGEFQ